MPGRWELSEEQWRVVEPILRPKQRPDGKGRPPADTRSVLHGVLWILGTGAQWREMPKKYPPYQTCHRRFQQWVQTGKLEKVLRKLAQRLRAEGRLNLEEAFIDATFVAAKKGAWPSVLPSEARGPRSRLSPLATVYLSPSVSKLLRRTNRNLSRKPLDTASSMTFRCD
jgi:transposase